MPAERLGILLISGGHARAHYAFVLATGAAAIGREVVLFATNEGCHALRAEPAALLSDDAEMERRGVAGFGPLRDAAIELGVRLIACEAGLRIAGVSDSMAATVEIAGVTTFLEATRGGQIITV